MMMNKATDQTMKDSLLFCVCRRWSSAVALLPRAPKLKEASRKKKGTRCRVWQHSIVLVEFGYDGARRSIALVVSR